MEEKTKLNMRISVKIGDIIVDRSGRKTKVLEVLENTFLSSSFESPIRTQCWYTFDEFVTKGFTIQPNRTISDVLSDLNEEDKEIIKRELNK